MPSPAGRMKPFQVDHVLTTTKTIYACPGIAGIVRKITYFNPVVTTAGSVRDLEEHDLAALDGDHQQRHLDLHNAD